jgi:hypothetical protein
MKLLSHALVISGLVLCGSACSSGDAEQGGQQPPSFESNDAGRPTTEAPSWDGGGNAGASGDASTSRQGDATGTDDPTDCPGGTHIGANGQCTANLCSADTSTCSDLQTVKVCNEDGSAFEQYPCPIDQTCYLGACWAPICEPGEQASVCDGANVLKCNSLGIEWVPYPCGTGETCVDGACSTMPPNILFLVDTSGSMNWLPDGTSANDCFGGGCPSWTMPNCDNGAEPLTRLGKVKQAIRAVLDSNLVTSMRLALQRFAQVPFTETLFPAECAGGYWIPSGDVGLMTGDTDPTQHLASSVGWFGQNLDEILPMPFPEAGDTDFAGMREWLDDVETVTEGGPSCFDSSECNGGPCLSTGGFFSNGSCAQIQNPELRAIGGTPLGKSLFYAGEYLRNFVFVEGKACVLDSDCGTSTHTCVSGACHDPMAECRQTIIIAFTDGEETENVHVDDFFHPRVQAKRLHFGLGCQTNDDCLSGASCDGNRCVPPAEALDESANICETGGTPCNSTSDCPDPCATWTGCQGYCTPAQVNVTDGNGADHLFSHGGTKRAVTVNVVDASGVPGANEDISAYGGGKHFSVDLTDPAMLVSSVNEIIGDTKSAGPCGGP